jgi:hypothetical protein
MDLWWNKTSWWEHMAEEAAKKPKGQEGPGSQFLLPGHISPTLPMTYFLPRLIS